VRAQRAVLAKLCIKMDAQGQALLKIHLRRALIHVQKCTDTSLALLDVCGEAGDLFFLLQYLLLEAGNDHGRLAELLQDMLALMRAMDPSQPLFLSRRELMQMAQTLD